MDNKDLPIVTFSNDQTVAGGNNWLASITPEEEVASIVSYAASQGYTAFAYFGPDSDIGRRIATALQFEADRNGAFMITKAMYPESTTSPDSEAKYVAQSINNAINAGDKVAVLIPERGNMIRRVGPLLAYHGVNVRTTKLLGLSGWNDPAVWREPSLKDAWFVSTSPEDENAFRARYERLYGRAPSSLASVAYDAAAMAFQIIGDGVVDQSEFTDKNGFRGVNGLFRFRVDGTAERRLPILEVSGSGARVVQPAAATFTPGIG